MPILPLTTILSTFSTGRLQALGFDPDFPLSSRPVFLCQPSKPPCPTFCFFYGAAAGFRFRPGLPPHRFFNGAAAGSRFRPGLPPPLFQRGGCKPTFSTRTSPAAFSTGRLQTHIFDPDFPRRFFNGAAANPRFRPGLPPPLFQRGGCKPTFSTRTSPAAFSTGRLQAFGFDPDSPVAPAPFSFVSRASRRARLFCFFYGAAASPHFRPGLPPPLFQWGGCRPAFSTRTSPAAPAPFSFVSRASRRA